MSGSSLDQINDGVDRILLRRILHGLNVCFTILIQVHDRIKKNIMIKLFLFKNDTVALTFERTGILDLVSTTCICRKWNQKIRFVQCKKFADRIGSGSGDNEICQSKEVF